MHVLLVEDDPLVASGIQAGLESHDFTVDHVDGLEAARRAFQALPSDIVVLDRRLPEGDGLSLLGEWRAAGVTTPVLLLTARDSVEDRVAGLNEGADDYLIKPFDLDELVARLQALLRRAAGRSSPTIEHGPLRFDIQARCVSVAGRRIDLARRELLLLEAFLQAPKRVLSAEQLRASLYGLNDETESNVLNVHIHYLRRKLGSGVIETVRGLGYRLGPPEAVRAPEPDGARA
ncbi:response regulator [Pistricoccus aurantiacus]|uniref:response regulator n=1 Tax=Pistricoccus aurantiacus TaxID=1883414 RepID=UPI00363D9868